MKESSSCWKDALGVLNSSCKAMYDNEQSRLALAFANCHFKKSGRKTYPCPHDRSMEECTNGESMTDAAFHVYTEFFAHTSNMCYFLQSQVWQEETKRIINRLSHTSKATVEKLEEALHYHRLMEEKQAEALENQDRIISRYRQIAQYLETTRSDMDAAFKDMQEKAESQKAILGNVAETLEVELGNIQWALSTISGEVTTLETAAFYIATFLVVSFLPRDGASRLLLYTMLLSYGTMVEGGIKMFTTLHWVLWCGRCFALLVMAVVYRWLHYDRQQQCYCMRRLPESTRQLHTTPTTSVFTDNQDKELTDIETGTQLIDFLSAVYIKVNSRVLTETENCSDHTSNYTYTYESSMDTDDPQEYTIPTYQPEKEVCYEKDSVTHDVRTNTRWDNIGGDATQYNLCPRVWSPYRSPYIPI